MGRRQGVTAGQEGLRRFAVIGSPVEHSLSPVLHSAAYRALGIADARYERHEVMAGRLEDFLARGVGRQLQGLSVTMPGKPEAFALADEHDAVSRQLGVANTLLRREGGGWRAENHDVHGIAASLRDHGADSITAGAVLGSGATALSALAALLSLGARTVLLSARSPEKLAPLSELAAGAGAETRTTGTRVRTGAGARTEARTVRLGRTRRHRTRRSGRTGPRAADQKAAVFDHRKAAAIVPPIAAVPMAVAVVMTNVVAGERVGDASQDVSEKIFESVGAGSRKSE